MLEVRSTSGHSSIQLPRGKMHWCGAQPTGDEHGQDFLIQSIKLLTAQAKQSARILEQGYEPESSPLPSCFGPHHAPLLL